MEAEPVLSGVHPDRVADLYSRYAPEAGRLAYLLTGDHELAEDTAQEAFIRSIVRFKTLRSPNAFRAYLRQSVINLTRKHWRRQTVENSYLRRQGVAQAMGQQALPDLATRDEVWRALLRIPYEQRAALVLRFFADLSERDAAAALGCPRGTLKSRVWRGLEALRIQMRGDDDE
jgi:RNA polymerase sigma-70 factor (sigma-E family)